MKKLMEAMEALEKAKKDPTPDNYYYAMHKIEEYEGPEVAELKEDLDSIELMGFPEEAPGKNMAGFARRVSKRKADKKVLENGKFAKTKKIQETINNADDPIRRSRARKKAKNLETAAQKIEKHVERRISKRTKGKVEKAEE